MITKKRNAIMSLINDFVAQFEKDNELYESVRKQAAFLVENSLKDS